MFKKSIALLLSLGMTCSLLAGCGSASTDSKAASADSSGGKKAVTLTYLASQDWIRDSEKELAKKFEQQTGIKIDFQIVPADQYNNILKTKLNSKECTDIFGGQSGKWDLAPVYDVADNCVDLSGEEWAKRMDPLVAEQLTYNNKLYGINLMDASSDYYIIYNKKIFSKLNLQVPNNYEEFKNVCQKIKDAGITPIYECVSDGWHHVLWFPEVGPQFENKEKGLTDKLNSNDTKFADSAIMKQDLTEIQQMVKLGFWGTNYMSNTYADTEKNMASGKYAMTVYSFGLPAQIEKAFPDSKADDYGYFPIPLVDNQIINVQPAGPSKFIYSGSKHIAEAKQYFEFLAQQENLQYFLDNEPRYASLCFKGVKPHYTAEQQKFFDTYKDKGTGTVFQDTVKYLNPQWMDIGKDLSSMFLGAKTPDQVLKDIDQRRSDMAKAAKDSAWNK